MDSAQITELLTNPVTLVVGAVVALAALRLLKTVALIALVVGVAIIFWPVLNGQPIEEVFADLDGKAMVDEIMYLLQQGYQLMLDLIDQFASA